MLTTKHQKPLYARERQWRAGQNKRRLGGLATQRRAAHTRRSGVTLIGFPAHLRFGSIFTERSMESPLRTTKKCPPIRKDVALFAVSRLRYYALTTITLLGRFAGFSAASVIPGLATSAIRHLFLCGPRLTLETRLKEFNRLLNCLGDND